MTEVQAHAAARRRSLVHPHPYYVVYESGEWDCATDYEMDTFYSGNEPIAAYVHGERES